MSTSKSHYVCFNSCLKRIVLHFSKICDSVLNNICLGLMCCVCEKQINALSEYSGVKVIACRHHANGFHISGLVEYLLHVGI